MARYYECDCKQAALKVEVFDDPGYEAVNLSLLVRPGAWTLRERLTAAWRLFWRGEESIIYFSYSLRKARAMAEYILSKINKLDSEGTDG